MTGAYPGISPFERENVASDAAAAAIDSPDGSAPPALAELVDSLLSDFERILAEPARLAPLN